MKNILSIDGGGVRTYFPLRILNEIEKRSNQSISTLFDFFTGVSAGSIITNLILLKNDEGQQKYTTSEILSIFKKQCQIIFSYTYFSRFKTAFGILGPKYSNENIEKSIIEYFGNTTLNELIKPTCILTYDINYSKPYYFNNLENPSLRVVDCILASTAAPTYFYPYTFILDNNEHLFIDGGVVTNNPAEICFLKAFENHEKDDFFTLSLGTGYYPNTSNLKNYYFGLYSWSHSILDTIFSANSNSQCNELIFLSKILEKEQQGTHKFHRFDIPIQQTIQLDDIYAFTIMEKIMDEWILKNDNELNLLCEKLLFHKMNKNSFLIVESPKHCI